MAVTSLETKKLLKEHNLWTAFCDERADMRTDEASAKDIEALMVSYVEKCMSPESKKIEKIWMK